VSLDSAFEKLYDNMFAALKGYSKEGTNLVDQGAGGLVPVNNVRPSDDPLEAVQGDSIIYSLTAHAEDLRSGKIEGTMAVTTGSPKNKLEAHKLMGLVRRALVPRALTDDGSKIRVARFSEEIAATDAGKIEETWRVATSFGFNMVEVPGG